MHSNLKKSCRECPFMKKSLKGYLGNMTAEQTHRHVMKEIPFACHMTRETKDGKQADIDDMQFCVGAMQYATKNAKRFRNPSMEKIRIKLSKDISKDDILSLPEFFEHHGKGG